MSVGSEDFVSQGITAFAGMLLVLGAIAYGAAREQARAERSDAGAVQRAGVVQPQSHTGEGSPHRSTPVEKRVAAAVVDSRRDDTRAGLPSANSRDLPLAAVATEQRSSPKSRSEERSKAGELPPGGAAAAPQPTAAEAAAGSGPAAGGPGGLPDQRPQINVDEQDHDFGRVWAGRTLTHSYEVRNSGTAPLEIVNVKPACGCTVAGDYDHMIAPGAIGHIPIELDSNKLHGNFIKQIMVTCNDPQREFLTLRVRGDVQHPINIEPRTVNFQYLKPAEENTAKVELTNNTAAPLHLTLEVPAPGGGGPFDAKLSETLPGQAYQLVVHSKPPYLEGRNSTLIEIQTDVPEMPTVEIPVVAYVLPKLEVQPLMVLVPEVREGDWNQTVTFTNRGESPVHLLSASCDASAVKLKVEEQQPGRQYAVHILLPAGFEPDLFGHVISLTTDHPEQPRLDVPLRGPAPTRQAVRELAGQPAPEAELVTTSEERVHTTSPEQNLVLVFYASWCPHSNRSLPEIEQLHQAYKDRGVRFVAVNQDNPNDVMERRRFLPEQSVAHFAELGASFDVVLDPQRRIGRLFKTVHYPGLFVIDKTGKIADALSGDLRGSRLDEFKAALDKLAAPPATPPAHGAAG